jgi:TerC family integral membrane protein
LHLGFLDDDSTKTINTGSSSSTPADSNSKNNNATPNNKLKSIFQPGSGPTVVIEPNEPDDLIYASAITRTLSWVSAAVLFGIGLFLTVGQGTAEEFFAGYLVEQSLSIDNLFVFLLLFDYFKVPLQNQDRVLNYGIYGAIIMRSIMIGLGSVALSQFHAILLVFASILIYSSANVLLGLGNDDEEEEDMGENSIVKFSRRLIDSTDSFDGNRFFTIENGIKKATPLFICLIAVEISDVVFAVDSIPAVFGVTENPLIVFTSNMFAIMGLRSLYTILSKAAQDLEYLEPAVAVVLGFIGYKMVLEYFGICIPTDLSLGVVLTFLSGGVGLSIYSKEQKKLENSGL